MPRSVTARHRKKRFVGGWLEETSWKETRIRAFPRHVVMEKKMLKAERNLSLPRVDALSTWFRLLQKFLSPVMFAIALGGENLSYCRKHLVENPWSACSLLSQWEFNMTPMTRPIERHNCFWRLCVKIMLKNNIVTGGWLDYIAKSYLCWKGSSC